MLRFAPPATVAKLRSIGRLDDLASFGTALVPGDWLDVADQVIDAGNGVPLWGAAAAALAVLGRDGRHAALAGAVGAGAGSATSNGVVKPLVHRPRPWRPSGGGRRTASFPSSHVTTGSAFAAAAAVVWPPSAAVTAPLVPVVAFSRVHSRQHRVGDAAGGAVLGAAVGAVVGAAYRIAFLPHARRAR